MPFTPFTASDFRAMRGATSASPPAAVREKVEELRRALDGFPEFQLDFFGPRIRRRAMRGSQGLVFGQARWQYDEHWFLYNVE